MARARFAGREDYDDTGDGSGTLIFPQDMEQEFYPESIKFGIYERQGPSYSKLKENVKIITGKATGIGQSDGGALSENIKENQNLIDTSLGFTGPERPQATKKREELIAAARASNNNLKEQRTENQIEDLKDSGQVLIDDVTKLSKEKSVEHHIQSIYLNMPSSVVFSESVGWQGADLGVIGALKSGAGGTAALENGLLSNAGALLGGGALALGGGGIAGGILGSVLGSGGLQSGIESAFKIKANPFKEQTFQGVDFRSFDFTFTLRARSQSDVIVIQDIIRSFRTHSKPTFEEGTNGAVFAYPKEFRIEFLTIFENTYETNSYLPEIKYCVCTSVNTNFAGTGWRSFEGGAPVDISLQLTFQETEIITGEDVMGETEVGRYADSGRMF
jgi:hypothetical protein